MADVRIYVEGGGDGPRGQSPLGWAYREFFSEFHGKMPKVVACGGRGSAYDDFMTAVRVYPDACVILLADAERPVVAPPRQHLAQNPDNWNLGRVEDDQVHLMVQAIEAWFIADRAALADYYGQGFNENPIPGRPPEEIPKDTLKNALKQAARQTGKKGYHEIHDGTRILARINPATVREKCPHCQRLFLVLARETGVPLPDLQ